MVNTLAIVLIFKNKSLQNSQSPYKISLAFADALYAVMITFQTLSNSLYYYDSSFENYYDGSNKLSYFKFTPSISFGNSFFLSYVLFVVLLVSLYTLLAASVDRLFAVLRPLKYRAMNVKRVSTFVCVAVWVLCIVLACFPTINQHGFEVFSKFF